MAEVLAKADELLEVDPSDSRHIFWEEMKRIFFAMREVEPEDLNDEVLADLMNAVDELSNVLARIGRLGQETAECREISGVDLIGRGLEPYEVTNGRRA